MPALIAAAAQVASSTIDTTINNLFKNKVYKSQAEATALQSRVAYLSDQQKQELAYKLQNSQDANEQAQIIADAAASVDESAFNAAVALQTSNQSSSKNTIIIVSGVILVAGLVTFLILRSTKK
jgi:predicted transcriptional regulator